MRNAPPMQLYFRFCGFVIVAVAAALILASGVAMLLQAGWAPAPVGWHLMLPLGLVKGLRYLSPSGNSIQAA
jgi:hypothetical protein